jgi:hypothetical protein
MRCEGRIGNKLLSITGNCTINLSSQMISKDDLRTDKELAERVEVLLLPKETQMLVCAEPN